MYSTVKQQAKHLSKNEYLILRELCYYAKNLTNEAIYNVRQYYFTEKKYLSAYENCKILKTSANFKMLNSNMAQQIIKNVDYEFKAFFSLLKLAKDGKYSFNECKLPQYLQKDGYATLIIRFIRISNNKLILPYSNQFKKNHNQIIINLPPTLVNKTIKEIRVIPKNNARFFEFQYVYESKNIQRNININNALAIDFGVNNLITAVTNTGKSFIIDGRRLKSINQWYNKENARLESIKDKQHFNKKTTHKQDILSFNRNNKINDYISKTARVVINYCIENNIGSLVVGYNKNFQRNNTIGKKNNQNFVYIPFGKLLNKLKYLCELNQIHFIQQEESYTSKASFWDKDTIPEFNKENKAKYNFSGKRISRGQYKSANGTILNADINAALNIMRKSSVVDLTVLYSRGEVDTPIRIRVA